MVLENIYRRMAYFLARKDHHDHCLSNYNLSSYYRHLGSHLSYFKYIRYYGHHLVLVHVASLIRECLVIKCDLIRLLRYSRFFLRMLSSMKILSADKCQ